MNTTILLLGATALMLLGIFMTKDSVPVLVGSMILACMAGAIDNKKDSK
jgi:hypothetical protein